MEDKRKEGKIPLYTCKSSGWLWFIHKAHKGSKFPIRACLSLTHVSMHITPDGKSAGNSRIFANLSLALYHTTLYFDESHCLKQNFKIHGSLPLSPSFDLA